VGTYNKRGRDRAIKRSSKRSRSRRKTSRTSKKRVSRITKRTTRKSSRTTTKRTRKNTRSRKPTRTRKTSNTSSIFNKLKTETLHFTAVLIFLLVGFILFTGSPALTGYFAADPSIPPTATEIQQQHSLPLELDLTTVFTDPDTEILSYGISPHPYLNTKISGSNLTITPYDGFQPTTLIVYAYDGQTVATLEMQVQ